MRSFTIGGIMNQKGIDLKKNLSTSNGSLYTLWLNINHRCNLRCEWCYAKMTEYKNHDMSIGTVKKYVDLSVELGTDSVVLIGGEPTLHSEFFEIIKIIKTAGLKPRLVTNGIIFSNREFLRKTIDAGLVSVAFSLKAPNRKVFLEDTGRDLFIEQVKALRNIVDSGIKNTISFAICKNLINNFNEIVQIVKSTGVDNLLIDTGKPIFLNGRFTSNGMSTPRELAKFIMEIYQKHEKSGLRILLKLALPFCLFTREFIEKMLSDENIVTGCSMMKEGNLIVGLDGDILPCNHLCDQSLGKIEQDFSDAREFQEFINTGSVAEFYQYINTCPDKRCISCSYWNICGSGCRLYWLHYGADSMLGDFSSPT